MNQRDVFDFIVDSLFVSPEQVAEEFDVDVNVAENILSEMAETDAIEQSRGRYWRIPGFDDLTDEAVDAIGLDAFGLPSQDDPAVPVVPPQPTESVEAQNRSEGVPETLEKPVVDKNERARANFTDMVENAPSDAARAFWQSKLDSLV